MTKTTGIRNGRGSVTPAKTRSGKIVRDVWRICYSWTDSDGERHREYDTHHGTKAEAWEKCDALKAAHDSGLKPEGSKTSFARFAADWQKAREESGELAEKTLSESARHVRILSEAIGDKALTEISAETVEKLLNDLRNKRRGRGGKKLSGRTLQAYYQCLSQILQKACDYDYILRNPCAKVKPPRAGEVERRALSAKDARRLLVTLERKEREERDSYESKEQRQKEWGADKGRHSLRGLSSAANLVGVRVALCTGMRLGEVLGLTWGCVNLKEGCIDIRECLTEFGTLKPPKSAAGRRTIWLDQATTAHLASWKRFQAAQLRKIGAASIAKPLPPTTPVICSDTGSYAGTRNFTRWWAAWRDANGFPGLKFHELRHTQATQLLANGVDVKTVQTRLGHADPALTLKWYAHSVQENDKRAAALIGGLLASSAQRESA